ncbi:MAG: archaemetzincin [Pyrinomonadaceae bacterium]
MSRTLSKSAAKAAALFLVLLAAGCSTEQPSASASNVSAKRDSRAEQLLREKDAVAGFFKPMTVRDGDWLDTQKEAGETFEEYLASGPTLPTAERRTIYIQPIGKFTAEQKRAVKLSAEYMKAFYSLPVKLNREIPLGTVPADKRRKIEYKNNLQIRTAYFLDDVLPKLLPDDAAALIAFTNYDLYPGNTWSFVFGQATFSERVGVYSLYRLSDSTVAGRSETDKLLTRTLKIAMHETGHMFSMKHCTKYECLMSGTNHLAETDRRPLDNCPECMAKLAWAMDYDPAERYKKLAAFWDKYGRPDEARAFREKANKYADARK